MKLIIDIDEDVYKLFTGNGQGMKVVRFNLENTLKNGIPLPKGHGRLIDADYLREDFKASKRISFAERMDISCIVDHAPTIVEADGGDENECHY